jgi:Protein of unknown function (DUF2587)
MGVRRVTLSQNFWHTTRVEQEPTSPVAVNPDEVLGPGEEEESTSTSGADFISQPAKVMRLGAMVKSLLDEARSAPLDEAGRTRMREIYDTTLEELSSALSSDLSNELRRMAPPFKSDVPSESELRIAQAQLVGWLEGLFHGIQASLFAQQAAAQAQLQQMRERSLTPGQDVAPGTYL